MRNETLSLPASPRSVRAARAWVAAHLASLGRDELVPSAELAVSELVTNAILHATSAVTVRFTGTLDRPRIEVSDRSVMPPQPMGEESGTLRTTGRGLAIVAMHSVAWGSEVEDDSHGKTVWFEPSCEVHEEADFAGDLFDLGDLATDLDPAPDPGPTVPVDLFNMPVALMAASRRSWTDLRRELNLLCISQPGSHPLVEQLLEHWSVVEHERRSAVGVEALDEAIAARAASVDLHYEVSLSAPGAFALMRDLSAKLYDTFADQELLAALPSPEIRSLQAWYFDQFISQSAGRPPRPWTGPAAPLSDRP